jgi:hypothetical protein
MLQSQVDYILHHEHRTYYSKVMNRHPSNSSVSYNSTMCGCLRLEQIFASRRKSSKLNINTRHECIEQVYHRQKILALAQIVRHQQFLLRTVFRLLYWYNDEQR